MKTTEFVERLITDLKPISGADSPLKYSVLCLGGALFLVGVSLALLPVRNDFQNKIETFHFILETAFWAMSTVCSLWIVYRGSLPGLSTQIAKMLNFGFLCLISGLLVSRTSWTGFTAQLASEFNPSRMICFTLILLTTALGSASLFYWSNRHAPTHLRETGFWILASAAGLGSFTMQLSCAHDSPVHIGVWHVAPLFVFGLIGSLLANKILRWQK